MALDKDSMNRVRAMIFQRKNRKTPHILAQPHSQDAGSGFASRQLIAKLQNFIFAAPLQETQA
jgi:hypothetical protein